MEANYFTILRWFLPYINMNQLQVYVCLTIMNRTPHITSHHSSGLSQSTSFECPASYVKLALVFYFTYGNIHVQRRQWHPTPVLLPGKSHGQRSLVGCSPWGRTESDTTERLHFHFSLSCIGKGNGNPLQCSCLENPRDRGAWWAAVYGVTQSRTRLKQLSNIHVSMLFSHIIPPSLSPTSSHPRFLPHTPKVCFLHLCLFCCLGYRVIITVFLNYIYMH